jgi:hypothetical protein
MRGAPTRFLAIVTECEGNCVETRGRNNVICSAGATRRELANYAIISRRGEVAEWSKAPDSKSGIRQRIVGSNPTLSASGNARRTSEARALAVASASRATERWMSG